MTTSGKKVGAEELKASRRLPLYYNIYEKGGKITMAYDYNMLYEADRAKDVDPVNYGFGFLGLSCFYENK